MALTRGFVKNAATQPLDARLMDMAKVVANVDGSPRAGVLGTGSTAIVTALATMNVSIAPAEFVATKGKADGVTIFTNDGVVNVPIATAPASNSRIDVIYVKHNDNTTGDATSTPNFAVATGTAAASPAKPSIPTGALELATLRVYAGTTAANGGSNTLVNTYQMTSMRGGVVGFRTKADLDAWTTAVPEQPAAVLADTTAANNTSYVRRGGTWVVAGGGDKILDVEVVGQVLVPNVWGTVASITATTAGKECFAEALISAFNGTSGADRNIKYRILLDGVQIDKQVSGAGGYTLPLANVPRVPGTVAALSTPSAGPHTWELQAIASASSSVYVETASLKVTERG